MEMASSLDAGLEHSGLPEHLEMMARRRLVHREAELTARHLAVSLVEHVNDLEADRVREGSQDVRQLQLVACGIVKLHGGPGGHHAACASASRTTGSSRSSADGDRRTYQTRPEARRATP